MVGDATRSRLVTVCAERLCASCWHGEFMCWDARYADTVEKTVAELDALHLEHPHHYSVENVRRVCGPAAIPPALGRRR